MTLNVIHDRFARLKDENSSQLDLFGHNPKSTNRVISLDLDHHNQFSFFEILRRTECDTIIDCRPLMSYPHPKFRASEVAQYFYKQSIQVFYASHFFEDDRQSYANSLNFEDHFCRSNSRCVALLAIGDSASETVMNTLKEKLVKEQGYITIFAR